MAKRERATPIVHDDGFTINGCTFHVASKYQPLDAIGQGSYGVVCSVKNNETGDKLAIKKITPMAGDEWDATHTLREIRLMRCLGAHENIIALKDLSMCQEKDELYMMMELADTDLHRLIQSSCPLSDGHIRVIMYQILSGVKALHDNGVLHRDLKPGNLLLNKDCELKITDFGLARMIPKEDPASDEAAAAKAVISPMTEYVVTRWYRPPELMLAPSGCYDGAIDMWSVGCILGELIARKPMFPGSDFMDQLTRVFKLIPIPDKDARGYIIEKDALKFLSSLPPAPADALDRFGKSAGPLACDLLKRLLCFNPKDRLSADEALAHQFFDGVKDEWGEISALKLGHSLEFAFETQSLPLATLRQYICDEVRAFSQQDDSLRSKRKEQLAATKASTTAAVEPQDVARPSKQAQQPAAAAVANNKEKVSVSNDCVAGKGFTIKGCEFNVPTNYKPLQVLGEGSYGIVCAASDATSKKNVAIKKITPMAGDEWDAKHTLREIRLMRYFGHHPNIASLQNLSTCIEKDELYIMMELVDTDLHRLIQSKTKLEEAHIAAIMYQILCGALALHENGVLHRDLKPGNLLVSRNCDVKITDFGLSRYIPHGGRGADGAGDAQPHHTADKAKELMTEYVVTRWYRPPEIMLAPNGTYNEAVDMWSIGCIFGELLNRRPMFPGSDFIDQLTKVFTVLPVPPRDKRGYSVDGDALKFLESLPPASPSALSKLFRKASPEAVSLLRRLLCINPERRISAKQALAHPYFKSIRQQLGDPPEFQVGKAFDFEFDYHEFPLAHLKSLIQAEVKLLQKDGLAPPSVLKKNLPAESQQQRAEATSKDSKPAKEHVENVKAEPVEDELSDESDSLLVESLDSKDTAVLPAAHGPTKEPSGPETDECDSAPSDSSLQRQQQRRDLDKERSRQPAVDSDTEDEPQEVIQVVDRSRRTTTASSSSSSSSNRLSRPKSTAPSARQSSSHRDEDERAVPTKTRTSSHATSNNNSNHAAASGAEHTERWGHTRSSATASRTHQPLQVPTSSTGHSRIKTTPISARGATGSTGMLARTGSSNQLKDSGDGDKSDAVRHAERVNSNTHRSSDGTTRTTPRSSSSSSSTATATAAKKEAPLPEGWIKKTHSKSGREYYYDTTNKVSSWKHPSKILDSIFGTSRATTTSRSSNNNSSHKIATPTSNGASSADSLTPESSTIRTSGTINARRTSLSSGSSSSSSAAMTLPKEWARRTDPKTGRLFYVNLLTNRSYSRLPSSVTTAMLNASKQQQQQQQQQQPQHQQQSTAANTTVAKKMIDLKKKVTVPQSPQFSQMSWERKRGPGSYD